MGGNGRIIKAVLEGEACSRLLQKVRLTDGIRWNRRWSKKVYSEPTTRILKPLPARPGAGREGWGSPGIHLRLLPFCSLVKEELGLGLQVRDTEVGVLEPFPFVTFASAQAVC